MTLLWFGAKKKQKSVCCLHVEWSFVEAEDVNYVKNNNWFLLNIYFPVRLATVSAYCTKISLKELGIICKAATHDPTNL